ncbi:hypothetical protein SCUCBS95973_001091 [Sporothrix curviconia]|uniref:Uncharacterized protein n=1 Tax=Sporothrix curviconia TaxID=1260050 RepID=A0ABP0AVU1_9PEZI
MFAAVMMPPSFGPGPGSPDRLPMMPAAFASSPFRPSRPSPLSSSPIRAFSPPASASHMMYSQLDTQSSPIQPSSSAPLVFGSSITSLPDMNAQTSQQQQQQPPIFNFNGDANNANKGPKFRFAARPTKPVPRGQQSRDAAQQTRRTLFLRNVRQRADDRNWDRRNFEQELQKLEWWSLERELRQARESDVMSMLTEQDIEDAEDWMASPSLSQESSSSMPSFYGHGDSLDSNMDTDHARRHNSGGMYYDRAANEEDGETEDERMAELLAMEEEAEMEALIASMQADSATGQPADGLVHVQPPERPASTVYSDDEDYDAIFDEILSGVEEDTEMGSF